MNSSIISQIHWFGSSRSTGAGPESRGIEVSDLVLWLVDDSYYLKD